MEPPTPRGQRRPATLIAKDAIASTTNIAIKALGLRVKTDPCPATRGAGTVTVVGATLCVARRVVLCAKIAIFTTSSPAYAGIRLIPRLSGRVWYRLRADSWCVRGIEELRRAVQCTGVRPLGVAIPVAVVLATVVRGRIRHPVVGLLGEVHQRDAWDGIRRRLVDVERFAQDNAAARILHHSQGLTTQSSAVEVEPVGALCAPDNTVPTRCPAAGAGEQLGILDVRQDSVPPVVAGNSKVRKAFVIVLRVHLHGQPELLDVRKAAGLARLLAGPGEDREQNGGQDGNDGDNDQQLDERETFTHCDQLLSTCPRQVNRHKGGFCLRRHNSKAVFTAWPF